jgi:hypothetical protein
MVVRDSDRSGARRSLVRAQIWLVGLAFVLFAGDTTWTRGVGSHPDRHETAAVVVDEARLKASTQRIARRSALWRDAVDTVERLGRRVYLFTPDQVAMLDSERARSATAFERDVLAEAAPVVGREGRIDAALVVVNLALVERAHGWRGSLPAEIEADLDRILAHEVYGHALPYLLAGDLSGRCADPLPGQPATESCAIRRENAVRAELKLGRRTESGLASLILARTFAR